jgi:hypothetical protein
MDPKSKSTYFVLELPIYIYVSDNLSFMIIFFSFFSFKVAFWFSCINCIQGLSGQASV